MKKENGIWIITDCDGVWLGRARERADGDNTHYDYANLLMELAMLRDSRGYELVALTDRGGAQLAPLNYVFGGSQFWGGESGAVAYNAYTHSTIINPYFWGIVKKIETIRREFEEYFKEFYPIEPGVYSSIRVERQNEDDLSPAFNFLSTVAEKFDYLTCADHGDCISLKPKEIDKLVGIQWIKSLYKETQNPINFENSLWIGDGDSDIPVAKHVLENGGKIAGVANSQSGYKQFISENNGYISLATHTRGMQEIIRHFFG